MMVRHVKKVYRYFKNNFKKSITSDKVADLFSSLDTFSSSSIGGPGIHPIVDCEHPLLCLLSPGLVSQRTAITPSLQQRLASVCNGVSFWMLIMGWIPGYGSLYMVHPFISHRIPYSPYIFKGNLLL